MAGLLYFLPELKSLNETEAHQRLSALGFAHVLELGTPAAQGPMIGNDVTGGPGGAHGVIIAPQAPVGSGGEGANAFYEPAHQTWSEVWAPGAAADAKPALWIGQDQRRPPRPQDLVRAETVRGIPVALADGHEWTIPVVPMRVTTLPQRIRMGRAGEATLEIDRRFDALVQETEEWVRIFLARLAHQKARDEALALPEGEPRAGALAKLPAPPAYPDLDARLRFAALLLGVNYRVGPWEASNVLGLITVDSFWSVVMVAMGYPSLEDADNQKKTPVA